MRTSVEGVPHFEQGGRVSGDEFCFGSDGVMALALPVETGSERQPAPLKQPAWRPRAAIECSAPEPGMNRAFGMELGDDIFTVAVV